MAFSVFRRQDPDNGSIRMNGNIAEGILYVQGVCLISDVAERGNAPAVSSYDTAENKKPDNDECSCSEQP